MNVVLALVVIAALLVALVVVAVTEMRYKYAKRREREARLRRVVSEQETRARIRRMPR